MYTSSNNGTMYFNEEDEEKCEFSGTANEPHLPCAPPPAGPPR